MDVLTTNNGVCVLQGNDIVLALTESYDEACKAQEDFVYDGPEPYNYQYEINFDTESEKQEFSDMLDRFLGDYKCSFILMETDKSITVMGYCIL